jgi:hypothetical protein
VGGRAAAEAQRSNSKAGAAKWPAPTPFLPFAPLTPPRLLLPRAPPVDAAARTGALALLEAITSAERSHSGRAEEAPLGQWEVEALAPRADVLPPQLALAAPGVSARRLSVEAIAAMGQAVVAGGAWGGGGGMMRAHRTTRRTTRAVRGPPSARLWLAPGTAHARAATVRFEPRRPTAACATVAPPPAGANTVPRRLVVTSSSLLEREVDTHEARSEGGAMCRREALDGAWAPSSPPPQRH